MAIIFSTEKITLIILVSLLLSSCTNIPNQNQAQLLAENNLTTLYDYHLIESHSKQSLSVKALALSLKNTQTIFVGEFHTHQASHRLQLELFEALYENNTKLILSMEQFTRDNQAVLDSYLAGKYGEQTLIDDAKAWEEYKGSYRAIVEFAREHQIPVIAANAPSMFVRCVGRRGADFLKTLPIEKSSWAAQKLDLDNPKYKVKFLQFIKESGRKHGQTSKEASMRQLNTYAAQLLRDTTMAESIVKAVKLYPQHQIVHLNGSFHSDEHLGTVAIVESMLPEIKLSVISPIMIDDHDLAGIASSISDKQYLQGDYVYLLKELPERYLDKDKELASINQLIKERMKKKCEL